MIMRCTECGAEYIPGQQLCPVCNASLNQVRVMTNDDKEKFDGVTIDQGDRENAYRQSDYDNRSRIYVRRVSFNSGSSFGLLTKLLLGAGAVALIMLVALPLTLLFAAAALVGWFVFRRIR